MSAWTRGRMFLSCSAAVRPSGDSDDEPAATSYVIVGDSAYSVDPTRTKSYQLQLERLGGKAAVLFDEFNRWFAARWEGKALGVTIGCISAVVAGFLFWIASRTR